MGDPDARLIPAMALVQDPMQVSLVQDPMQVALVQGHRQGPLRRTLAMREERGENTSRRTQAPRVLS